MWVGEHSHIPASRRTPYPAGGDLPKGYWHLLDPFVSLGVAAAVTSRIRLGTGVCLVLEHDLLALAKSVATLDHLSDGRFDFGVGVGWNQEEYANHTEIPFRLRYRALREHIAALRTVWTEQEAASDGRFVRFEGLWAEPKPVQKPSPPVWFGAAGKLGIAHSAEWADGWCPIDTGFRDLAEGIERFRSAVTEAGRDPGSIPITLFVMGRADADKLRRYRDLGVDQVVLGTAGSVGRVLDRTLPVLDEWAALIPDIA
jgi:probable F420-dependent oxidoreductase